MVDEAGVPRSVIARLEEIARRITSHYTAGTAEDPQLADAIFELRAALRAGAEAPREDAQMAARLEQIHQKLLHAEALTVGDTVFLFDLVRTLRAEALAPPAPGWHPIETIPQEPCLIAWSDQRSPMSRGGPRVEMIGGRREYDEILGYGEPPATHWMPLPAAPSSSDTSTERAAALASGAAKDTDVYPQPEPVSAEPAQATPASSAALTGAVDALRDLSREELIAMVRGLNDVVQGRTVPLESISAAAPPRPPLAQKSEETPEAFFLSISGDAPLGIVLIGRDAVRKTLAEEFFGPEGPQTDGHREEEAHRWATFCDEENHCVFSHGLPFEWHERGEDYGICVTQITAPLPAPPRPPASGARTEAGWPPSTEVVETVNRLSRGFAQEWLRPDAPEHATEALVKTLSTVMLAFHSVALGVEERRAARPDAPEAP